jgi:phage shock protein PspC (stress-responsive transcriptional regulator)
MNKKLYRSRTDRKIWGVAGGLARYFNIDPTVVRVLFVVSILFGTLGIWVYIVMALIVPLEPLKSDSAINKKTGLNNTP